MKDIIYYNDTGRDVKIHPGIDKEVKFKDTKIIKHQEMIKFTFPKEFTPMLKMWDYGDLGLQLIIMLMTDDFLEDNFWYMSIRRDIMIVVPALLSTLALYSGWLAFNKLDLSVKNYKTD